MKILLIEDDREIAAYVARGLREAGHVTDVVANASDGQFLAESRRFDVLVVDRMLPDINGVDLVRALRRSGDQTPVLFLTALGRIDQRVEGFEAGGDDYLIKPFAFSEFLARVTALARRPPISSKSSHLICGGIALDRLKRTVTVDGAGVDLQPKEFLLLETLLLNQNEVVTRTMLLEKVWDFHFDPRTNIVETHVSRLRTKLGSAKDHIRTVRGTGYAARANVP
jgi:two-component system, OmpR family, response regulator